MNNAVRDAAVEWISLAIQRARPNQTDARGLADKLFEVAEQFDIPAEDVVVWIHAQRPFDALSKARIEHWAKSYDMTRAMQRKQQQERER